MPIYEYECHSCGERLEKFQKISDPPLTTCPSCNNDSLQKLVSAAAFKLTGSGWYETDFKDKKPKTDKKPAADKDKKPAGEKSESAKSASKDKKPGKSATASE